MDAQTPFDASAYSDVILRSVDNIDFFVIEGLLRLVSPVFNTTLSSNRVSALHEKKNDRPVFSVAEDSETLHHILSSIYPYVIQAKLNDCRLLLKVGAAVQKYRMETIENKFKIFLSTSARECGVGAFPDQFQLYATLVQLGWHHEATLAARNTLGTPLHLLPFIDELRHINGADFYGYLDLKSRHDRATSERKPRTKAGSTAKRLSVATSQQQSDTDTLVSRADKCFEPSKDADAILRSSDLVDFYILKALVLLASPTLGTKKSAKSEGGLPVFECDEDSETLHQLLLFIYPHGRLYQIDRLDTFHKLSKAAQKYKMAAAEERLKLLLLASSVPVDEPLRVFAIAVTLRWGDVAKSAAINTLNEPLDDMAYVEELKQITGADLYWLVQYRFQCVDAACEVVEMEPIFASQALHQRGPEKSTVKSRILDKLKVSPHGSAVVEACAEELEELAKGVFWDLKVVIKLLQRRDALVNAVEEAVWKVPLKLEGCEDSHIREIEMKDNE
ncbi:hypothetical protein APHAL10511_005272 [Amanita phalloides]|nr:hypothetical protein APHAL10511_005272 [Amanita phalloides]